MEDIVLNEIDSLLDRIRISVKEEARRLRESGGVDSGSYLPDHPYAFAELLVTAALRGHVNTTTSRWGKKIKSDFNNLKHF